MMGYVDAQGRKEIFMHPDIKHGRAQFKIVERPEDWVDLTDGQSTQPDGDSTGSSAEQKNRRPPDGVPPTLTVQSQ